MKILARIIAAGGVVVALLLLVGLFLPTEAHVERRIEIRASAETIFPYLLDFRKFNLWSPWADRDPGMTLAFEGPETGVGAKMIWGSQKDDVGSGSQETIAVMPGKSLRNRLDFGKRGQAESFFELTPIGDGCTVVWGFDSPLGKNPAGRYFGLMMDEMIGPMYDEGLAKIKELAEAGPADWT